MAGNFLLFLGVGTFLIVNNSASETVRSGTVNSAIATASSITNPLDQLSSAQIALVAAEMTKMPELTAVRNQADTENALLAVARSDTTVLSKPQIIETAQKSKKDIVRYVTKAGDSVSSIAATFRVSTNSIRWSNGLVGDTVAVGRTLYIPPADGIVYQVKSGDTIASLTSRYQSNRDLFINVNDAESGQLNPGEYIWIPNGVQPAPVVRFASSGFSWGSAPIYSPNGYDRGYCTWWAAYRRAQIGRPVPSNLGNACTWKNLAIVAGFGVGTKPAAGAVIWSPGGCLGHVGFVERMNDDGSIWVSDMNSRGFATMDTSSARAGGWNRISYRLVGPEETSRFWYIY